PSARRGPAFHSLLQFQKSTTEAQRARGGQGSRQSPRRRRIREEEWSRRAERIREVNTAIPKLTSIIRQEMLAIQFHRKVRYPDYGGWACRQRRTGCLDASVNTMHRCT